MNAILGKASGGERDYECSMSKIDFSRKGAKAKEDAKFKNLLCGFLCAFAPLREKTCY